MAGDSHRDCTQFASSLADGFTIPVLPSSARSSFSNCSQAGLLAPGSSSPSPSHAFYKAQWLY